MRKSIKIIGLLIFTISILTGCKKSIEIIKEEPPITINGEYGKLTLDYFFGKSFLKFNGQIVDFTVCSMDGWGNIINRRDLTGKYKLTDNGNGSYILELDFGKNTVNMDYLTGGFEPTRENVDYPLPEFLPVSIDSLNNVTINGWDKIKKEQ